MRLTQTVLDNGIQLPAVKRITPEMNKNDFKTDLIIAPPSADQSPWMNRFQPYSVGVCSGWMQVRGNARRRNVDAGFAMSDHADWKGLISVIRGIHDNPTVPGLVSMLSSCLRWKLYAARR